MQNCIEALIPPILKTGTSVDERDPKLNKNQNGFGFPNINFAGGLSYEGPSKKVENIDIN